MVVFLVPNSQKEHAIQVAISAAKILGDAGASVLVENYFCEYFKGLEVECTTQDEAFKCCDVIVTVGGDGTILRAARRSFEMQKPILGINVGHLGFLATVEVDELDRLKLLVEGKYNLDNRSILTAKTSANFEVQSALNEVVIGKTLVSQTIGIKIYCDDTLVNHFNGDGVIIATPTGSTAYSLSAGGPVLDARIAGLVVTPICAHSMHSPPMVFSAQRKLRVCFSSAKPSNIVCTCDGQYEMPLLDTDYVEVSLSDKHMTLVSFCDADQFHAIDKKLKGR